MNQKNSGKKKHVNNMYIIQNNKFQTQTLLFQTVHTKGTILQNHRHVYNVLCKIKS